MDVMPEEVSVGPDDGVSRDVLTALPGLLALAVALTGDLPAAEDLVNTAVVRFFTGDRTVEFVAPYLRTSVINLHRDSLRRLKLIRKHSAGVPVGADQYNFGQQADVRMDLARALADLSPLVRFVVVLRFLEDQSAEQIARVLGRPAGTVRRLTHVGLRALRAHPALTDHFSSNDRPEGR